MALKLMTIAAAALLQASSGVTAQVAPPKPPAPVVANPAASPAGVATLAFQARLKEYIAFRSRIDETVPKLKETSDPAKISARERALGEALMKSRVNAEPGEFFIKEYRPYLLDTIKQDFAKRTLAERKALIVELPKGVGVRVNTLYPTTIPLATFPANLLRALPDLPPELEYRIIYRHLLLRDVGGNYVVDMVREAFPIPM